MGRTRFPSGFSPANACGRPPDASESAAGGAGVSASAEAAATPTKSCRREDWQFCSCFCMAEKRFIWREAECHGRSELSERGLVPLRKVEEPRPDGSVEGFP